MLNSCRCPSGQDRAFGEDLVAMLCADNLATARSTVSKLIAYHSKATRIFFPRSCSNDPDAQRVQDERVETEV